MHSHFTSARRQPLYLRIERSGLLAVLVVLAGCSSVMAKELNLFCGDTVEQTVDHSSAVIYGAEIHPPAIEGTWPVYESDLIDVDAAMSANLGLLAKDGDGKSFDARCRAGQLCDADDVLSLLRRCDTGKGCQIVGGIKRGTFYPLYSSDNAGNHLCMR